VLGAPTDTQHHRHTHLRSYCLLVKQHNCTCNSCETGMYVATIVQLC
jgi:hypothetical protein